MEAFAHQALPFDHLLNHLRVQRETSRHPLFQVLFNMVADADLAMELPGFQVENMDSGDVQTPFDLNIGAYTSPSGLEIRSATCGERKRASCVRWRWIVATS